MNKLIKIIIIGSMFLMLHSKIFGFGVFGFGTISPALINNKYVQNAGIGAGIAFTPNWIFSTGMDNPVFNNFVGNFKDTLTNLSPQLFQNFYYLQIAYALEIDSMIHLAPAFAAGHNVLYYRTVYPSFYSIEQIYPDFGSANFFSLTPSINLYYDMYDWLRFSAGVGYNIPLNLNYEIKNSNGNSLKNQDMQSLAFIFSLQLGNFK